MEAIKINQEIWNKFNEDQREEALLSVIKDPDDIGSQIDDDWNDLPGWMQRDMRIWNNYIN